MTLLRISWWIDIDDLHVTHSQSDNRVAYDKHTAAGENDTGADLVHDSDAVWLALGKVSDERQRHGGQQTGEQRTRVENFDTVVVRMPNNGDEPLEDHYDT